MLQNTRTGKPQPIVSIDEALARTAAFSADEKAIADDFMLGAVIGDPQHCGSRLRELALELDVDELMLSSLVPSLEARKASLRRVAAAMS